MIRTRDGVSQVNKNNCKGEQVIRWDDKKKSCLYEEYIIIESWEAD